MFALPLAGLMAAAMYCANFRENRGRRCRLGVGGNAREGCDVSRDHFGVWYSAAALTPMAVLLGAAVVLAAGKPERPIKTPTAADDGSDFAGGGVQPGAVPVCGVDLSLLFVAADSAGAVAIVSTGKKQPGPTHWPR